MELLEGAQPGDPAIQLLKYTPSEAIRSNAGVFTKVQPAKLVCAKDWSSLMAKRIFGRLPGFCAIVEVKNANKIKRVIEYTLDVLIIEEFVN